MNYFQLSFLNLLLFGFTISSYAQVEPDKIFFFSNGNRIFYCLDGMGQITTFSRASTLRSVQLPMRSFPFGYEVVDHYPDGDTAFVGAVKNGLLHGPARYYHPAGYVRAEANYYEGKRSGIWKYYYPNSGLEMVHQYTKRRFLFLQYYRKGGKHMVIDGNGIFSKRYRTGGFGTPEYRMKGAVSDSLIHGVWRVGTVKEVFDKGTQKKGYGTVMSHLVRGSPSEIVVDLSPKIYTPGLSSIPLYNYEHDLNVFLDDYKKYMDEQIMPFDDLPNSWVLVSFSISDLGLVENAVVLSNDERVIGLTQMFLWDTHWIAGKDRTFREYLESTTPDSIKNTDRYQELIKYLGGMGSDSKDVGIISRTSNVETFIFFPAVVLDKEIVTPRFEYNYSILRTRN